MKKRKKNKGKPYHLALNIEGEPVVIEVKKFSNWLKNRDSYQLKEKKQLSYTILSDAGNKIAEQYGLRFPMNNMLLDIFKSFGVDNMAMIHGDNEIGRAHV